MPSPHGYDTGPVSAAAITIYQKNVARLEGEAEAYLRFSSLSRLRVHKGEGGQGAWEIPGQAYYALRVKEWWEAGPPGRPAHEEQD